MIPVWLISNWKLVAGGLAALAVAAAVGLFLAHYKHLESQAALVPGLQLRIASDDKRAADLSVALSKANAAREQAEHDLTQWQGVKTDLLEAVKKEGRHAAAATNPVCLPSAVDRSMRNDAFGKLLGTGRPASADSVSASGGASN